MIRSALILLGMLFLQAIWLGTNGAPFSGALFANVGDGLHQAVRIDQAALRALLVWLT